MSELASESSAMSVLARTSRWPWLVLGAIAVAAVGIPLIAGEQVADFSAALRPRASNTLSEPIIRATTCWSALRRVCGSHS